MPRGGSVSRAGGQAFQRVAAGLVRSPGGCFGNSFCGLRKLRSPGIGLRCRRCVLLPVAATARDGAQAGDDTGFE